mgnify:CR=1 FL=1
MSINWRLICRVFKEVLVSAHQNVSLTEPQKHVILTLKMNGGVFPKNRASAEFDMRVVNNLLRRNVLCVEDDNLVLVEYTAAAKKENKVVKRGKPRPCYCGCGDTTGGGRFLIGHDGRLHAKVKHYIKTGECLFDANYEEAKEYLKSVHWMTPEVWEVVSRA